MNRLTTTMPAPRMGFYVLCHLVSAATLEGSAWQRSGACDARLVAIAGELGYRSRGSDSRCEGLYVAPVSGPSLELVSVQQGRLQFDLLSGVTLRVHVPPATTRLAQERIRVRGVALPLRTYYRMDGIVSSQNPMNWPVGEVLLPAKLSDSQVGVFGWVGTDADKVFVPVRIAKAGDHPPSGGSVLLKVRTENDAEIVLWRSHTEDRQAGPPAWTVAGKSVTAGSTVTIELPIGPETVLTVDLRAKSYGSERWASLQARVLRPAHP